MRAAAPGPRTGDAAPAPSECLSEARYRLPRHAAVSFGSSDISGLFFASTVSPVADGGALVQRPRGRWFPKEGRPGARADSAPGESFSVAHCRLLHHTAVSFVSSDISVFSRMLRPSPLLMMHVPPALVWMSERLLHPPSLSRANGRGAVNTATWPKMNVSASAGRLSS